MRDKPRVVTDGKRIIVSLDGDWVRDPEGNYVQQHSPLREEDSLCFTVTRQGKLKFAKKVTVKPKFEKRTKLDDEGQPDFVSELVSAEVIPEPTGLLLVAIGAGGLGWLRRQRGYLRD